MNQRINLAAKPLRNILVRRISPYCLIALLAFHPSTGRGQSSNRIEITRISTYSAIIREFGTPGQTVRLEFSTNLYSPSWRSVARGYFGSNGVFEAAMSEKSSGFYRGVSPAPPPGGTSMSISGPEDSRFAISFRFDDPDKFSGSLSATLHTLPDAGTLFVDGNAITSVPVTLVNLRPLLSYLGPTNIFGSNIAAFSYSITRLEDGATSAVAVATISLNNVNDNPVAQPTNIVTTITNSVLFALPAGADVDDDAGTLAYHIVLGPPAGALYQASLATNATGVVTNRGEQIMEGGTLVTSPYRLLWYEADPALWTPEGDSFWYNASDPHGAFGPSQPVTITSADR